MTFKEEFSALEQKSLNQIVATKINKELSELRAGVDASPTIPKRWVWECAALLRATTNRRIGKI